MAEYIEREEAIKRIQKTYCADCNSYNGVKCRACGTGDAIDMIEDAPAADVAPVVHGRWVYDPNARDWNLGGYVCNLCGVINKNLPGDTRFNPLNFAGSAYCPNCGARMDGADNE